VEEVPNHLGRALTAAREREERGFARLGFEGVLNSLIYGLKPKTQRCPVKTTSVVLKTSETA
jgi:hypothetical protein